MSDEWKSYPVAPQDFKEQLRAAINRCSQENASNTPDWILRDYLLVCLDAFNAAVQQRENWYGRDPGPARIDLSPEKPPSSGGQ